jgi:voltage-gated potassium channel
MLLGHNDVRIKEVNCDLDANSIGKSIGELGIRDKSGANVVGIKKIDGQFVYNPPPQYVLQGNDKIFVLGSPEQIISFSQLIKGIV